MIEKIAKNTQKLQLGIGVLCISIFFITTVIQVVARYTGITVMWTGEVSTNSFIWSVLMGSGVMTYSNSHFAFDSLVHKLSEKKRIKLQIIISLIVLMFSLALLWYGTQITIKFWNYRLISLPVKKGYLWLALPILGFSNSIYSLNHIAKYFKELKIQKGGAND